MLADVQHQDEGVRFLRRVVEQKYVSPLLLVGDEGVGKRFSILQTVKELFCVESREKGCTCEACSQLDAGTHPDLTQLTAPEGKEIGVDAIRELIVESNGGPISAPFRCFVIDGVDRMTIAAGNAILKTLEEPPSKVRFFLITEFYDRVIPTIRSRSGKVSYRPLPEAFIVSVVQQFETDTGKALVYARMGEGSIGRAIRYWGAGRLGLRDRVFSLLRLTLDGDVSSLFPTVDTFGQDLPLALRFMDQLLFDILMTPYRTDSLINVDLTEDLVRLAASKPMSFWLDLTTRVKGLRDRHRSSRINLAFHVKAALAQPFSGV